MLKTLQRTVAHYFGNFLIFTVFLGVYSFHSYYRDFLSDEVLTVLKFFFSVYLVLGLPYYLIRFHFFSTEIDYARDKLVVLVNFIFRGKRSPENRAAARTAALSYLVKFFFLPLMLNFFFQHFQKLLELWHTANPDQSFVSFFWQWGYDFIFQTIFLIDTAVFAFAYAFEFRFLHNRIRSVDPFVSGWVVALICYPPLNSVADKFISLDKAFTLFDNVWVTDALKIGVLIAFLIYVWATLALGFKASNLTNRGIVTSGPYRFVRHPAYAAKNLAWWFEFLPFLDLGTFVALLGWNAIYILRALTEERHLSADPDYRRYAKKVRWRFIPGVI
ncbi:MAG: methyltransferase [Patescibacteria group bacterium]